MNSIVRVFSNFKEFYSEINGATLTGAIDVVVVEQPDGTYLCSPFHVRFGKLGVLRSREKIVDIEINGEPVNIHMKLGESGEAFFVEEVPEDDSEILPEYMATSPIPQNEFPKSFEDASRPSDTLEDIMLPMPLPRRNSIDFSKEIKDVEKKFENQVSDFSHRRHTDNTLERRDLSKTKQEYTTQKIRQEWEQDQLFLAENDNEWQNSTLKLKEVEEDDKHFRPIVSESLAKSLADDVTIKGDSPETTVVVDEKTDNKDKFAQEDSKSKKKRRKKSFIKKKNSQRKGSTSSSNGSTVSEIAEPETESTSLVTGTLTETSTLNDESAKPVDTQGDSKSEKKSVKESPSHLRNLDIHFFSDTEVAGPSGPRLSRPTTPVQSDTEFEVSQREKAENIMTHSASWKWGELPTHEEKADNTTSAEAKRNSKLSSMFSFMKQTRKQSTEGQGLYLSDLDAEGMDPEVAAMYFPPFSKETMSRSPPNNNEDDRESGNGTSLPQSPSSMELIKSVDSDYDEVKLTDKYLDFVALSLCGGLENGGPTNEDFERNRIEYSEVCRNPSIFSSTNLVVRLNGKYYSWTTACPIVMTILTFQKPLPNDVLERLISESTKKSIMPSSEQMLQQQQQQQQQQESRGYWFWRRPQQNADNDKPAIAQPQGGVVLSKQSPAVNIEKQSDPYNVSMSSENSDTSEHVFKPKEKYRKSLRLTSEQIESLGLNNGMNEISFSVTTAYQGTSRCQCYLFKWKYSDKVVISDIDGTITKSDVLGHLLPMVGKDWAQIGVAELFSKIEENGYKMLYLSARAIGQAKATREYLRSIRQGDVKLPEGPLLLNPTSLISAFHREVIEKKPEQFKIACLSDISDLFPDKNPFYAGYGNRINDVWAYTAVGIPISRIFTINTKGELKHELTQTFQSTYAGQSLVVNDIFPPLEIFLDTESEFDDGSEEFSADATSEDEAELQFGVEDLH